MADQPASGTAPQQEPAYRTIVCGIDGSPEGLEAARQAFAVGAEGASYWAVAAWDPGVAVHVGVRAFDVMKQLREHARSALREAEETFPGVRPMLIRGRDVAAVLAAIGNLEADRVCVGSHGGSRPAGVLFGSVASAMAHHAPCSVLIARQPLAGGFPGLIVHANDGSPESLDAARVAGRLAARHGSTPVTLHVSETHDRSVAEEAVAIIESSGREPVMKVEQGSPHRRIVEMANETGASLIVMGSRGRTGLAALGSVSERVAHPGWLLRTDRPARVAPGPRGRSGSALARLHNPPPAAEQVLRRSERPPRGGHPMTRRRTEQALAVSRASVRTVRLGTSVVAIVLAEVGLRVALV